MNKKYFSNNDYIKKKKFTIEFDFSFYVFEE